MAWRSSVSNFMLLSRCENLWPFLTFKSPHYNAKSTRHKSQFDCRKRNCLTPRHDHAAIRGGLLRSTIERRARAARYWPASLAARRTCLCFPHRWLQLTAYNQRHLQTDSYITRDADRKVRDVFLFVARVLHDVRFAPFVFPLIVDIWQMTNDKWFVIRSANYFWQQVKTTRRVQRYEVMSVWGY